MKLTKFATVTFIGVSMIVSVSGCRKNPEYMTRIPGGRTEKPVDNSPAPPLNPADQIGSQTNKDFSGYPMSNIDRSNWVAHAEILQADTVHFAYDSSVVKSSEKPHVSAVSDYLKANATNALRVEGHCDERGTEEYNRSLGERRALALRENLIALGIDPSRIETATFGKDRPIDPGHDESAWKKNRRGEFIVLTPPQ
jgi:peptidoglycan-associated lipoprotein